MIEKQIQNNNNLLSDLNTTVEKGTSDHEHGTELVVQALQNDIQKYILLWPKMPTSPLILHLLNRILLWINVFARKSMLCCQNTKWKTLQLTPRMKIFFSTVIKTQLYNDASKHFFLNNNTTENYYHQQLQEA